MLLERFTVTIDSFIYSKKVQAERRQEEVKVALEKARAEFIPAAAAEITLAQVFAARSNLARIQKVSGGNDGSIKATVKDVRIGRVPDRGGRVDVASGASRNEAARHESSANHNPFSSGPCKCYRRRRPT